MFIKCWWPFCRLDRNCNCFIPGESSNQLERQISDTSSWISRDFVWHILHLILRISPTLILQHELDLVRDNFIIHTISSFPWKSGVFLLRSDLIVFLWSFIEIPQSEVLASVQYHINWWRTFLEIRISLFTEYWSGKGISWGYNLN